MPICSGGFNQVRVQLWWTRGRPERLVLMSLIRVPALWVRMARCWFRWR